LTSQTGTQSQPGSLIQTIQFVVVGLREIFFTALHNHVASRAGAATAAGMFQVNPKVQTNVENGFRLPMLLVREFPQLKLNRLPVNGYLRHNLIVAGYRTILHLYPAIFQ
jgi:hypothetical protein